MPGNWVVTIDLGKPFDVTAAKTEVPWCRYVRIEFADQKSAAEVADWIELGGVTMRQENPVVAGEVLSDPPAIQEVPDQKAMQRSRRSLLEYTAAHGWMSTKAMQELDDLRAQDTGEDNDAAS
jgi:hypothetical protein